MAITKSCIKKTAIAAFVSSFGVVPKMSNITIHYCNDDRTEIWFSIGCHLYWFKSYTFSDGTVWCGDGKCHKIDKAIKCIREDGTFIIVPEDSPSTVENFKEYNIWSNYFGKWEEKCWWKEV